METLLKEGRFLSFLVLLRLPERIRYLLVLLTQNSFPYAVKGSNSPTLLQVHAFRISCVAYSKGKVCISWLVRSSPERAVWVGALAEGIALCSWARHFTLTVSLSTQVYKWVSANLMLGVTLRWTSIPSRGE